DRASLEARSFTVEETSWTFDPPVSGTRVLVQHRAHGERVPATVEWRDGECLVDLGEPVEAVAPGQSAAFYGGDAPDELIGGGVISATVRADVVA
ncbi:MAG: tRNA-uridine 2-sulfurtransferase, partial [Actinomycetota bacterium]|nr:tRNA-uridine 2-sulfurtransferase [Actinomycetota bacterium]